MSQGRRPGEDGQIDILGIPGADNRWFPSQGQARNAALAWANQLGLGYQLVHDPRPRRGLPHYHVVTPAGQRLSGHFFYGRQLPRRRLRNRPLREFEAELATAATAAQYQTEGEAMLGRLWNWIRRTGRATPAQQPTRQTPALPVAAGHPYRGGPTHAKIQAQIRQAEQAVRAASRLRVAAARQFAQANQAFQPLRRPAPGRIRDLDQERIILNRYTNAQRRLRAAERTLIEAEERLRRLQEQLQTMPEAEAMLQRRPASRRLRGMTGMGRAPMRRPRLRMQMAGTNGASRNGRPPGGHGGRAGNGAPGNGSGNGRGGGRRRGLPGGLATIARAVTEVAQMVEQQIQLSPAAGRCAAPIATFRLARQELQNALLNPRAAGGPEAVVRARNAFNQSVNNVLRCLGLPSLL